MNVMDDKVERNVRKPSVPGSSRSLRHVSLCVMLMVAIVPFPIVLSGCQTPDPEVQSAESSGTAASVSAAPVEVDTVIPFRHDGSLSISRDGDVYQELAIEIAATDSARTRGLMQRSSMPGNSGMLFLFDREDRQSFWMANTPLSLDLIFINADSIIVHVAKYAQPLSPDPVPSLDPARFVLEVEAGYSDTAGILEGDRVNWTRDR